MRTPPPLSSAPADSPSPGAEAPFRMNRSRSPRILPGGVERKWRRTARGPLAAAEQISHRAPKRALLFDVVGDSRPRCAGRRRNCPLNIHSEFQSTGRAIVRHDLAAAKTLVDNRYRPHRIRRYPLADTTDDAYTTSSNHHRDLDVIGDRRSVHPCAPEAFGNGMPDSRGRRPPYRGKRSEFGGWFFPATGADASSSGKECVEVAHLSEGMVGVRDSKNPTGPALVFAPTEWDAFTARLERGGFDLT
ncbi:DUF397 domain-containing protein [Nocardia nova]